MEMRSLLSPAAHPDHSNSCPLFMSAEPFWKESLVGCPDATTAVLPVSAFGCFPGVYTAVPSVSKPVHGKGREICPEQCRCSSAVSSQVWSEDRPGLGCKYLRHLLGEQSLLRWDPSPAHPEHSRSSAGNMPPCHMAYLPSEGSVFV